MARVDIVLKIGGGLLAHAGCLDAALAAASDRARTSRLLIVPGGGPFADAVRAVDRQLGLPAEAAHWMAILGMDQYAHLIAARLPDAILVTHPTQIAARAAERSGASHAVGVLAPYHWLRDADPLPHSWSVTSDSIAAWVAGEVGASRLILVKPPGATGEAVDGYFKHALPSRVRSTSLPGDDIAALRSALGEGV
jgi:aspartokinase-like uncharacterized kinase